MCNHEETSLTISSGGSLGSTSPLVNILIKPLACQIYILFPLSSLSSSRPTPCCCCCTLCNCPEGPKSHDNLMNFWWNVICICKNGHQESTVWTSSRYKLGFWLGQGMPFFEGLDLHGKCCTSITIIEYLLEEWHTHHVQSHYCHRNAKEFAETAQGTPQCKQSVHIPHVKWSVPALPYLPYPDMVMNNIINFVLWYDVQLFSVLMWWYVFAKDN